GSEQATKWYVEQVLEAGCGFVNCIPVFIAREKYWSKRFKKAGVPIVGDDIKSQVGATIVHRTLARLFHERGVKMLRTSQLNVGGNMDFYNMLELERLESKKISKTNAVTSIMDEQLPAQDVYIGPSDYVPWLTDRKWAHIRVEGQAFGDVPLNVELKLEVWDSPNSAGIVIDAVRCCKLALNHGVGGQLDGPSSYLMKSPRNQRPDDQAHRDTEKFIAKYSGPPAPPPTPPGPPAQGTRPPGENNNPRAGAARGHPQSLLEGTDAGSPRVIAVGEVLDVAGATRRRPSALPIDVARTVEELLTTVALDFVHVHEPFAPSTSNAALRHSRALNVGSFHSSSERLLSTLVARRFVESFFGRLDPRTASLPATAELMARQFPGDYRLVPDGAGAPARLEDSYGGRPPRRHSRDGDPAVRDRLAGRALIEVDLHMHTDHSHDCATPVEVLLATAREQGLGAIAVTDHNEISGALEARAQADGAGVKVIVGEEVKTAGQGEVIGLFIEEKIPRGLSLAETVAEIKRQGGLVYVPHPFDRMHSVPDYEHLLTILADVDAIEVYNPRVAIGAFNEEASRFAAKYRIPAGAGSDSHVAQGLGSVRIR